MLRHPTLIIFVLGLAFMAIGFGLLGLAWRLRGARAARLVFDAEEERDLAWGCILVGYAMGMVGGLLEFGADAPLWTYATVLVMVPVVAYAAVWLRIRARRATLDELGDLPEEADEEATGEDVDPDPVPEDEALPPSSKPAWPYE